MACEKPLSSAQVRKVLKADLPGWSLARGAIRRSFTTPGWPHTMMLANAVAHAAEAAFHHPDLALSWNRVTVSLSTHAAKDVTEKDLALAKRIERLVTWQPDRASPLEGFTRAQGKKWVE